MSSPGESGPRTERRTDHAAARPGPNDASVTASLPAVSDAGPGGSPYPQGAMPGAGSRDAWKAPGAAATPRDPNRTEAVPAVAGVGASAGAAARPSFGDQLPPRPGATTGNGRPAAAGGGTAARRVREAVKPARRAQLTLRRFNVWSVFKFSCMLAIALWLVWMIAIGVLYGILDGAGVVGSINNVYQQLQGSSAGNIVRPTQVLG